MPDRKVSTDKVVRRLERDYQWLVSQTTAPRRILPLRTASLEQRSFLKVVDTVTTYGAYEDPI